MRRNVRVFTSGWTSSEAAELIRGKEGEFEIMAGKSAIAARRINVINNLERLPGAIVDADAPSAKDKIGLKTSGVNVTSHDLLLSNTELLEFLDHVLTPLVARVDALEAELNMKKGTN
jgi:hypothetical protein